MALIIVLIMSLMSNVPIYSNTEYVSPSPKIEKFYTNIPEIDNWVVVPKSTKEITINVEALNTETVLFWLVPTGSEQWNERKLIGFDIKNDGDNKFSMTWKIPEHLHHHLYVEALGDNNIEHTSLNIYSIP
jgi:hypothetical protein